jgi:hypothetical protein
VAWPARRWRAGGMRCPGSHQAKGRVWGGVLGVAAETGAPAERWKDHWLSLGMRPVHGSVQTAGHEMLLSVAQAELLARWASCSGAFLAGCREGARERRSMEGGRGWQLGPASGVQHAWR